MTTSNQQPASPAAPAATDEADISVFTPARLREAPKNEPEELADAETEVPVADDAGEDGDDAGGTDDNGAVRGEERSDKRKRTLVNRINRLTADKRYWESEAISQRARIDALEAKLAALTAPEKIPLTAEKAPDNTPAVQAPDASKYRYGELDPQYLSDLADYRAELKITAHLQKQEEAQRAIAAQREAEQAYVELRQKAEAVTKAGQAKFSDFEDVVVEAAKRGDFALTQEMFETVAETQAAAEILYHLATNPEESVKVSEMSPRQQALWFGRMEARFAAETTPKPRKVSGAPAPLSPTRGNNGEFLASAATKDFAAFERLVQQRGN